MRASAIARAVMLACAVPSVAFAMQARQPPCPDCDARGRDSAHAVSVQRARVASERGAWNEAAELWRDALVEDDRVAEHWLMLGDVLSRADRQREAVAAYQRAIQLDARLTRAGTRRVARAFAHLGDDRQAVRWLELALRAGVRPEDVWSDEAFEGYRNDPRLRAPARLQVRRSAREPRGGARRS